MFKHNLQISEEIKLSKDIITSEVITLMKELISIPSPYFHEDAIMDFTYRWFIKNGMSAYIHEYHESRITNFKGKNVISEINGKSDGPTICINGHMDTVNLCNGWSKDPYEGVVEGDKIYGLGALDMKSGCCASMLAIKKFHELHKTFHGKIIATFVSDEEGPYGLGTNALIEEGLLKDVDFSIITEPSEGSDNPCYPDVSLGARGGYGLEVEFFGKAAHAALPATGINAAMDAGKFMCELEKIDYDEAAFLGKGVACVIAVESDGGACSVPDYAKVKLFWHIVIGEDEKTIENYIIDAVRKANIQSTFKISFRDAPTGGSKGYMPFIVAKQNHFVAAFLESIKDIYDREANISYFKCIGDFNYLGSRLNAPAIIFGNEGKNFHGADEYATISSIIKTADIIYNFLVKVLSDNSCSSFGKNSENTQGLTVC
ncbi:M20/M25/M40 family metallo-hydrolase [Clostridium algoriphilum]|uniref:M20 family metallopeptidase n=1 Tax=Clostridium algoriphilum TaxID=198347 RepID=UPI001CF5D241|nr:M20/M25/M40 family metallo-hydrolase [Clostridium algoriphilum]MCB2294384.1 M20/M25/M40 family metallo-hydrolase [Clostridium algoriphilum]